jgi:hypothetical protein
MGEDLAKYLDDEGSSQYVSACRARPKPKSQPNYDGWNGGYSKPKSRRRDNGETGTGKKSSGKRNRCAVDGCQAFESPARSGYCSYHESKHLNEGEKPTELKGRLCMECHNLCEPPRPGEDEPQYCNQCLEWRGNPDREWEDELEL